MAERKRRWGCVIAAALPVVVIGVCVAALALQAPTFRVSRVRTLATTPERIHDIVSDVRVFASCCAGHGVREPAAAVSFSPTTTGVGAWFEAGPIHGRMRARLTEVDAQHVVFDHSVSGGGRSRQTIEWSARGAGTEVRSTFTGDKSGVLQRLLWPVAGLEAHLGEVLDEQLDQLDAATR